MECTGAEWLSTEEYLRQFNRKAEQMRIPLSGSIELTRMCNLRCVHCYIGGQADWDKTHSGEMGENMLFSVIDEITEAGCLEILLTGGEPLLRKDFADIYRYIKQNGILTTVFSNGTLITDRILDLFGELPPQAIEISLYGASEETYEKITGVAASFRKCISGIEKLLDLKIRVKLKTVLMTLNSHEFYEMKKIAADFGVKFRFDAAIFPSFQGDKAPLGLRVSPEEAIEKEFADEKTLKDWKDFYEKYSKYSIPDTLYSCSAGNTNFHIDAYGNLQPCLMPTDIVYDLNNGNFNTGWQTVIPDILKRMPSEKYVCGKCSIRMLCAYCPAFFKLENGVETVRSDYMCSLGKYRFQMIQKTGIMI